MDMRTSKQTPWSSFVIAKMLVTCEVCDCYGSFTTVARSSVTRMCHGCDLRWVMRSRSVSSNLIFFFVGMDFHDSSLFLNI